MTAAARAAALGVTGRCVRPLPRPGGRSVRSVRTGRRGRSLAAVDRARRRARRAEQVAPGRPAAPRAAQARVRSSVPPVRVPGATPARRGAVRVTVTGAPRRVVATGRGRPAPATVLAWPAAEGALRVVRPSGTAVRIAGRVSARGRRVGTRVRGATTTRGRVATPGRALAPSGRARARHRVSQEAGPTVRSTGTVGHPGRAALPATRAAATATVVLSDPRVTGRRTAARLSAPSARRNGPPRSGLHPLGASGIVVRATPGVGGRRAWQPAPTSVAAGPIAGATPRARPGPVRTSAGRDLRRTTVVAIRRATCRRAGREGDTRRTTGGRRRVSVRRSRRATPGTAPRTALPARVTTAEPPATAHGSRSAGRPAAVPASAPEGAARRASVRTLRAATVRPRATAPRTGQVPRRVRDSGTGRAAVTVTDRAPAGPHVRRRTGRRAPRVCDPTASATGPDGRAGSGPAPHAPGAARTSRRAGSGTTTVVRPAHRSPSASTRPSCPRTSPSRTSTAR